MPDYALVKDPSGDVCGIWLQDPDKWLSSANEKGAARYMDLQILCVSRGLPESVFDNIVRGKFRLVRNTLDNNGGAFLMFGSSPAPGESMAPKKPWWKIW